MGFTHRTSHGAHGLGDVSTLGSHASATLAEIKLAHPCVFEEPVFSVGREEGWQHKILLRDEGKDPPRKKLYPLDLVEQAALKEQLDVLLKSGRIVHSSSQYGASILFAKKKDSDKLRMCIDYRALN